MIDVIEETWDQAAREFGERTLSILNVTNCRPRRVDRVVDDVGEVMAAGIIAGMESLAADLLSRGVSADDIKASTASLRARLEHWSPNFQPAETQRRRR